MGRGPRRAGAGGGPPGRGSPPRLLGFFFRFFPRSARGGPPGLPPLPEPLPDGPPDSARGGEPPAAAGAAPGGGSLSPEEPAGGVVGLSESRGRSGVPGSAEYTLVESVMDSGSRAGLGSQPLTQLVHLALQEPGGTAIGEDKIGLGLLFPGGKLEGLAFSRFRLADVFFSQACEAQSLRTLNSNNEIKIAGKTFLQQEGNLDNGGSVRLRRHRPPPHPGHPRMEQSLQPGQLGWLRKDPAGHRGAVHLTARTQHPGTPPVAESRPDFRLVEFLADEIVRGKREPPPLREGRQRGRLARADRAGQAEAEGSGPRGSGGERGHERAAAAAADHDLLAASAFTQGENGLRHCLTGPAVVHPCPWPSRPFSLPSPGEWIPR